MAMSAAASAVEEIVRGHEPGRGSLIAILQEIQDKLGYLSPQAVDELAALTGLSANEIYGVASFYTQFRFAAPARHAVCVCQGTACYTRGGRKVLKEIENRLGIHAGQSTGDGQWGLETVACVGCCALGPVVVVDGKVNAGVTPQKAGEAVPVRER